MVRLVQVRFVLLTLALLVLAPTVAPGRAAGAQATPVATPAGPTVTIDSPAGPLVGLDQGDYQTFQGIPYAAPPTGERRWLAPQPLPDWSTPRDATAPGSVCAQPPDALTGGDPGSEDCLFLNITSPAGASAAAPRPVLVWIHGGGFVGGAGSFTNADRLTTQGDLVVVTINYRLGIFGFLGHPALDGGGNLGLQDQAAALAWVQRNISAFGGDPANVTIAGESAGAMSLCALQTAPTTAGLFERVIIQSGACTLNWPANAFFPGTPAGSLWTAPAASADLATGFAEAAGCADPATALACLRAQSSAALLASPLAGIGAAPAWGGTFLPADPVAQLAAGDFHVTPVLSGTTATEASFFLALGLQGAPFTEELFDQYLTDAFGTAAPAVRAEYADLVAESPAVAWSQISTDRIWICPNQQANAVFAATAPVYAYLFADPAPPPVLPDPGFPLGTFHAAEIPYLFDYVGTTAPDLLTPPQLALSDAMIAYWAAFAHSGDPNVAALPGWPPFDPTADTTVGLALAPGPGGIGPFDIGNAHRCGFWAEHGLPAFPPAG